MLRYENANDSGYALGSSIQPVNNGELANQTVLRRPSENLRVRTDAIRQFLDKRTLLEQIYHHFVLLPEDPATRIYFDGSKFYLNTDGSSGTSTRGLKLTAFFKDSVYYPMARVDYGGIGNEAAFLIKSQRSAAAGGNNIKFKTVISGNDHSITITTTPETDPDPEKGPVLITATCGSGATLGDLQNALSTNSFVRIPYISSNSASIPTLSEFYIATTTILKPSGPNIVSCGSAGRTTIYITAAKLNDFFSSNSLAENDILVVQFSSINALLSCNESTEVSLEKISGTDASSSGTLPILSDVLSDDLVIPIATVLGSGANAVLVFRDGSVFPKVATPFTKGPFFGNYWTDSRIIAGTKGGSIPQLQFPEGTVESQLSGLMDAFDDHIDTGDFSKPHSLHLIKNKPFVSVGTNGDYSSLNSAISALLSTGGTIFLLSDCTVTANVNVGGFTKDIVVFGNGKTITFSGSGTWIMQTSSSSGSFHFYNTKFNTTGTWTLIQGTSKIFLEDCSLSGSFVSLAPVLAGVNCTFSRTDDVPLIYSAQAYIESVSFQLYLKDCNLSGTRLFQISGIGGTFSALLDNVVVQYTATNAVISTNLETHLICRDCNLQLTGLAKLCSLSGVLKRLFLQGCYIYAGCIVETSTITRGLVQGCVLDITGDWFKAQSGTKDADTFLTLESCYSGGWSSYIFRELPARNIKLSGVHLAGGGALIYSSAGDEFKIFIADSTFSTSVDEDGTIIIRLAGGSYLLNVRNCDFKLHRATLLYALASIDVTFTNNRVVFSFGAATTPLITGVYNMNFTGNYFRQTGSIYSTTTLFTYGNYINNRFELYGNTGYATPLISAYLFSNNSLSVSTTSTALAAEAKIFTENYVVGTTNKIYGVRPLSSGFTCVGNLFEGVYRGIYINTIAGLTGLRISDNSFELINDASTPPIGIAIAVSGAVVICTLTGNYFRRTVDTAGQAYGLQTQLTNNGKLRIAGYGNYFRRFTASTASDVWDGIEDSGVICYGALGTSDTHPYLQPTPTNKDKFFAHQIITAD